VVDEARDRGIVVRREAQDVSFGPIQDLSNPLLKRLRLPEGSADATASG
jgi:hypothetical protein